MKTILLICAIAALATAIPSNDMPIDDEMFNPETDIVIPEDTAAEEEESLVAENAEYRRYSKISHHSKLKGSIKNLNKEIAEKSKHAKEANKRGRKEDAKEDKIGGLMKLPLCASLDRNARHWKKFQGKTYAGAMDCRCKGGKVPSYLKEKSKTNPYKNGWNGKFNGDASHFGGPHAKPCYIEYGKKSGMANPDTKPCPRDGRATSTTCSPPPKVYKKKYCKCTIDNGWHGGKTFKSEGHKSLTLKPAQWQHRGKGHLFRGIKCTGCEFVKIEDDDPGTLIGGHPQDWYLGKNDAARHAARGDKRMQGAHGTNESCCGKKTCSIGKTHLGHKGYDLRDDVSKITMQGAC